MEKRFECEDTGIVGGSKIFPVVILFGCETHNKEKIPVWYQNKFLPFLTSNYYQPFSHVCCIADSQFYSQNHICKSKNAP